MEEHATDLLTDRLKTVLVGFPDVAAAYLFGSRAEGRAGRDSDTDVGVILQERTADRGRLKLDLLAEFVKHGLDDVDLVFLSGDDVVTRFEAVRPNLLVYAVPEFDSGSFYSRALREYWDLLPLLRWQRESLKERLQDDPA